MEKPLKKAIELIKEKKIKPDPKWKHLAVKYLIWIIFFILIFASALCFAVAYYLASQLDWDLHLYENKNFFSDIISLSPWIWILMMALFLLASLFNLRKTEGGYRWSRKKIALISLGTAFVLASASAFSGAGFAINNAVQKNIPSYSKIVTTKEKQWSRPESGFLAGSIEKYQKEEIELKDFSGKSWNVEITENTVIRPAAELNEDSKIKSIGKMKNENTFEAYEIRPWQGKGNFRKGGNWHSNNAEGRFGKKKH